MEAKDLAELIVVNIQDKDGVFILQTPEIHPVMYDMAGNPTIVLVDEKTGFRKYSITINTH